VRLPEPIASVAPQAGYLTSRLNEAQEGMDLERLFRVLDATFSPYLPEDRNSPILEVGFGRGGFLDYLNARGYEAYAGVETDRECFEACRGRHRVHVVDDTTDFLHQRPARFEVVVLRQVISHLERDDALSLLRGAREALTDGGRVALETFNAALPTAGYTLANDLCNRVAYTEHSLRQVLILAGFRDITVVGSDAPTHGFRGLAFRVARRLVLAPTRLRMALERGRGGNPTIWSKNLLAIARKG
jgi:SAM-dependent methyltransferase